MQFPRIQTCGMSNHSQTLTTSKKKSTCGLLCTKKRTGCLSMTTCAREETQHDSKVQVDTLEHNGLQTCKTRPSVLWGWSLAAFLVSLWVLEPRHGESGSASRPSPEPGSSSLLHLKLIDTWNQSWGSQPWLESMSLEVAYSPKTEPGLAQVTAATKRQWIEVGFKAPSFPSLKKKPLWLSTKGTEWKF